MSTEVKRRYGTTAQHAIFTGAAHEITIDTDKNTAVVHDGVTAGGHPLSKASELTTHEADTSTHGVTGAIVGTTDTQTLTGKTISVDNNTVSGIAASSFVLSDASGNIDGTAAQKAIPTGVVVGTTDSQTLSGKGISLTTNTVTGTAAEFDTACTDDNFFFQSDVVTSLLSACGVPVGNAPSGTMGDNGAVTLGTVLSNISGGLWLYFPANAIFTGSSAGLYWTVMSTSTAGTVYNNTYDGTAAVPSVPSSPTPFVTTGPGAYTGSTAEIYVATVTLPANSLGPNGNINLKLFSSYYNSANTKTLKAYFGGQNFISINVTSTWNMYIERLIGNLGATNSQISQYVGSTAPGAVNANPFIGTVDTTSNQTISFSLQATTATDFILLRYFGIEYTYGVAT